MAVTGGCTGGLGLLMSDAERDRAYLVRQTLECRLGQREAAGRLGTSVRQFKCLLHRLKSQGDAGVVSRQRGRASTWVCGHETHEFANH